MSGGLDSVVSLAIAREKYNIELALTFDYGQKSVKQEILSSDKICKYYNVAHKVIKLDWLEKITHTALVSDSDIPVNIDLENSKEAAKSVWVPNRNGLFLNIAAMYCDSFNIDYIIFGANKEEAETFSDNSIQFNNIADEFFKLSTLKKPKILAPCANLEKYEIVQEGVNLNVDFSLLKSCYNSIKKTGKSHCGVCESCKRLHSAIVKSNNKNLLNIIF